VISPENSVKLKGEFHQSTYEQDKGILFFKLDFCSAHFYLIRDGVYAYK